MTESLLNVKDLNITFRDGHERVEAVKGVNFNIRKGETLAVVGESGSGKSVTALALTKLLPDPPVCELSGNIWYGEADVLRLSGRELRAIRGGEIAYVFQEPSASLNPVFSVGYQVAEAVRLHTPEATDVKERVVKALGDVGIRDPEKRYKAYPHEMSGGMLQRVMIAMALACGPKLLVADEPTTALDVTIQKQIMDLLAEVRERTGMAILLITHNFGIVNGFADRVVVMFRGEIVEEGSTVEVLKAPQHPYTKALISCIPRIDDRRERLPVIDRSILGV